MSKQAQAAENLADKKSKSRTEPVASPELTNNLAGLALLPGGLLAANGSGSIEAQATRLANPHWQSVQRQALARQIGRVQGNRHLQRMIASLPIQRTPELTEEERAKIEADKTKFRQGSYTLTNNIPSTGLGKFDASYDPNSGTLKIIVKIAFNFQDAKDKPIFGTFFTSEEDYRNAIWSDEEKESYMAKFAQAAEAKWSAKYPINCKKSHWEEFVTNTAIVVAPIPGQVADAHYQVTIYKLSKEALEKIKKDPTLQPRAEVFHADDPTKPGKADFYERDIESRVSNSGRIAAEELQRLKDGLNNSGAAWVNFDTDSDAVKDTGPLNQFASVLNNAYPSAPAFPINIIGYFADGETGGEGLAKQRAQAVAMVFANAGVLQPLRSSANSEPRSRQVGIAVEGATSTTNLRRVSDHEFGHMLGLPDEYDAHGGERESDKHKKAETEFQQKVSSAGLDMPAMGKDTSSVMSVGVDVLPAHYVTIKEALGRMTSQHISESEWQIGA